VARLRAELSSPRAQMMLGALLVSQGIRLLAQSADGRISALESRGWVPQDDVATIGDLIKLEERLGGEALEPTDEEDPATAPEG